MAATSSQSGSQSNVSRPAIVETETGDSLLPKWKVEKNYYRGIFGEQLPTEPEKRALRLTNWTNEIRRFCTVNNCFSFTISELQEAFRRPVDELSQTPLQPRGLHNVFAALPDTFITAKSLSALASQSNAQMLRPPGWGARIVMSVIQMACRSISAQSEECIGPSSVVLFKPGLVERAAASRDELSTSDELVERILLHSDAMASLRRVASSTAEAKLLLDYLVAEKQVMLIDSGTVQGVKVLLPREQYNEESDVGILRTKAQMKTLEQFLERVEREIEAETQLAIQHKAKGEIPSAKRRLVHRALLRKVASEREEVLQTFRAQLMAIRSAHSSLEIMNALQIGTAALQALQKQTPINTIAETIENAQESIELQHELDQAIGQNIVQFSLEEEHALEQELEGLREQALLEALPLVPIDPLPVLPTPASLSDPVVQRQSDTAAEPALIAQ